MGRLFLVGLGNPGSDYSFTRHNLGYMLMDSLTGGGFRKNAGCRFLYLDTPDFTAVKPVTYMNRSGQAVKSLLEEYSASPEDILVACDDFNLPLGKIRLRKSGSAGGHNGLGSIIESLGTDSFARLRMGIGGSEEPDKASYVLGVFNKKELESVTEMIIDARNLIECYIKEGPETAMTRYNS